MSEKALLEITDAQKVLAEIGFDFDEEVQNLSVESNGLDLPRVRVEHRDSGKHVLYVDQGSSYLDDDSLELKIPGNRLVATVIHEQAIRAFWTEKEPVPTCSGISNRPITSEPLSESCHNCPEAVIGTGKCKPNVRLQILAEIEGEIKPLIFNLSPTSIKHWNTHKKKLQRSNLPVVAVNTVFELIDVKKNGYRWAEVNVSVSGIASKEMLILAKQARTELEQLTKSISHNDFAEMGDRN